MCFPEDFEVVVVVGDARGESQRIKPVENRRIEVVPIRSWDNGPVR